MQTFLKKITRNPYIQTSLALVITMIVVTLLGNMLFQPHPNSNIQLFSIIGIGITLLLFFAFSLWKVNQQKQWVSSWASHRFWILLTFLSLPALLLIVFNITPFSNIITEELMIKNGDIYIPHFMFFYFWEALIFGIAFLAHPERKYIEWKFSPKQFIFSLLLSSGIWSVIMFLNEIQLQWTSIRLPYLDSQAIFWPVLPLAIIFIPISVTFILFHDFYKLSLLNKIAVILVFIVLPLRTICLFPALILSIVFLILNQKKNSFSITVLTYALFNLFMILLNWNWVL